jgi:hypothetical protein
MPSLDESIPLSRSSETVIPKTPTDMKIIELYGISNTNSTISFSAPVSNDDEKSQKKKKKSKKLPSIPPLSKKSQKNSYSE